MTLKKCAFSSGSGAVSVAITEMNRKIQGNMNEYFQWIWRTLIFYNYIKLCQLGKIGFSFLWKAPFTHLFMEVWFDFYLLRKQFWWNHNKKTWSRRQVSGWTADVLSLNITWKFHFNNPLLIPVIDTDRLIVPHIDDIYLNLNFDVPDSLIRIHYS